MTDNQKNWVEARRVVINLIYKTFGCNKDYVNEAVVMLVDGITEEAKGNEEVRSEMLDLLEKWEVKRKNDETRRD